MDKESVADFAEDNEVPLQSASSELDINVRLSVPKIKQILAKHYWDWDRIGTWIDTTVSSTEDNGMEQ